MNLLKNIASSLLDEQEKFTDLTQVAVVDEDACLDVLKKRFDHSSIYTHCGPLLVAVNPYKELDALYSEELLQSCRRVQGVCEPTPMEFTANIESQQRTEFQQSRAAPLSHR